MGYDWALIAQLEAESQRRARAYRCPFVEALDAHRSGRASFDETPFIRESAQILAITSNAKELVGERIRGEVTGWRSVPRRPPYHVRRRVRERANAVAGEIYVRTSSYIDGASYEGS